jgi:uncharacterized protein
MATTIYPRNLQKNFDVYLGTDGINLIGQASKLRIPQIKGKVEDLRNSGMHFPIETRNGYDKMDAELHMPGLDPVMMAMFGIEIGKVDLLMATAAFVDEQTGDTHSGVFTGWGFIREAKFDDFEPGNKKADNTFTWSFHRWKWSYDGFSLEADPFTGLSINGVSAEAKINRALLRA